jgi:hypothetical protein
VRQLEQPVQGEGVGIFLGGNRQGVKANPIEVR